MFLFRDGDLELQLLEERHAVELFGMTDENRSYLREWLPWLDSTQTVADTRTFIQSQVAAFAKGTALTLGIWRDGALVGTIGLGAIDRINRMTMIGYWLDAGEQGRGTMTRACSALVDYAFRELDLNRVEIHCATGNSRSCAIPERLGFTLEGVLRENEWLYDRFVDHRVYAMLSSDRQR
jgi:ribosomal-protein-serine acetyltransferase